MPTMDDLPKLLQENEAVRNDFLATMVGFLQRQGITVTEDDIKGVALSGDVRGYVGPGGALDLAGLAGHPGHLQPTAGTLAPSLVYTTTGNNRSRTFWI